MMEVQHWIDGRDVQGTGPKLEVVDPSTGDVVAILPEADADQVAEAVAAARRTFDTGTWSRTAHGERRAVLRRAAQLIRDDADALVDLQVTEGGMLPNQVRAQAMGAAAWFDYFADFLSREGGESYRQLGPGATTLVEREPIGVCALFSPWNVPVGLSAIKLAPALAAGNSVVLKPSEETPMVTRRLVDIVNGAGLPAGVLSCVNGRGAGTGAALAEAAVDMVSFTGGHAGGEAVAMAAAKACIPCVMELGGKSAAIVFDDADLDAALEGTLRGIYGNNGMACLAGSRILLQDTIAEDFIARFRARAEAMTVGDPRKDDVALGPMVSGAQRDRVLGFYESAARDGDAVLFGGAAEGQGFFVRPGGIRVASGQSRVWREEVFGPLAAFATFSNEDDATAMGNDSTYGLVGYVWTRDLGRAMRVSRALRVGTVLINAGFMRELNAPFGGYKQSGVGREGGAHSWMNFTEAKTTVIHYG